MIQYLLDTNICIALIRHRHGGVLARLTACAPGTVGISSITLSELECGVKKSMQPEKNGLALAIFTAELQIPPYGCDAASHYGEIRAKLERVGTPIGTLDTLIAAHARSLGAVMVTDNEREFCRVDGLHMENWLQEE